MSMLKIIGVIILVAILSAGGFVWYGFQTAESHGEITYSVDIKKTGTPTTFSLNLLSPNAEFDVIVDETNFDKWMHPQSIIDEPQGDPSYELWVYINDPNGVKIFEVHNGLTLSVKNQVVGTNIHISSSIISLSETGPLGEYNLFMTLRMKVLPSSIGWTTLDTETIKLDVGF
jgi:hypothetical protein